ncbi:RCC1 domain-containing protein [Bdellovibrio sp. GT3]|uniref:RCC1 domain-containing protein n=1 Tax=Bdellovibrio sp. GT3 TaxID=3136282 RepID=UPI0030F0FF88
MEHTRTYLNNCILKLALSLAPVLLVGCSIDLSLEELSSNSASSLAWDQQVLNSSGDLQAQWAAPTSEKIVQQELLYYKGASCEDPILPSIQLGADTGENTASFLKDEGQQYTFRVYSMDVTGKVTPSACSSPVIYQDSFAVNTTAAGGLVNEANVASVPFFGRCGQGASVTVSAPSAANILTFTCATTGTWTRGIDLSAVSGIYAGDVTFTVTPSGGGTPKAYTVAIDKDTVPPTVDIPSAVGITAANQSAYTVSGTCSENGASVAIAIGSINTTATCSGGSFSRTLDVTGLTGNTITLSATHADSYTNTRSKFVITTRYVTVPTITSVALNAGTAATTSLSATFNLNVTDATEMYVTNSATCATGGAWEAFATAKAWTLPSANSSNTVYVKFRESHGNETACVSDDILHDNINPTVSITSPIASSYVNSANVAAFTISGACSENGRSITITGPSSFTSTATCSGSAFSAILNLSSLAQGSFQLDAAISDVAGNSGSGTSPTYIKDTGLPTGTISINNGNVGTTSLSANLTLTTSDSGGEMYVTNTSGCASGGVWETFAGSKSWTLPTANATNTVYTKFRDLAGNESTCYSDSIDHSSAVPTVTIASPASGSYINLGNATAFTISGACSENGNAVDLTITGLSAQSATCSGGAWSKTIDVSSLSDASISFTANHSRSAGVDATPASQSYTKDTVAPTVQTFVIKNDDLYTGNLTNLVTIAATGATEMYITNNALCLTGGTWESYTTAQIWTLTTADSLNTAYFKTRDVAGNESNCVSDSITHDGSNPVLAWSTPTNLSYINSNNASSFTVSGTCNLNGRTVDFMVYLGAVDQGISNSTTCNSGTWTANLNLSGLADTSGTPFSIFARLTALNGNTHSPTRNFYKDTVAPGTATISGAPTGTNTAATLNITVGGTGVTHYRYFIVPPSGSELCTNTAAYTGADIAIATKITGSLTEQGLYKVCVLGRDANGNYSAATAETTWTRDSVGPIPQSIASSTVDGTYGVNAAINVSVTFNENVNVTGSPRIAMEVGGATRYATYASGAGTTTLNFTYTVAIGDMSADLDYTSAATISNGTLIDALLNAATRTLPAAGSAGSLAGQKSIVINAPLPVAVLTGAPTGTYTGSAINVTVSGTNITQYKYNVISTGTCATSSYTTAIAVATPINTTVFSHPNGPVTLCVLGGDASGNFQLASAATSATWIRDSYNTLSISSSRMNRVMEGSGAQVVTISMDATKVYDVIANYRVSGDASYPSQHDLIDGSVTIPAGSTSANVTINFPDNALTSGERVLNFSISNVSTEMAYPTNNYQAQFFIADDEKNLTVTKASIGRKHSCAIMSDSSLRCWGFNSYGQIGDASTTFRSEAIIISPGTSFKDVGVGNEHTCAVATNGDLYCWGRNANGQVGNNGAGVDKNTPELIDSGVSYAFVSSGENHSCGLTTGSKIRCWGQGMHGALGQGGTGNLNIPTEIDAANDYKYVSVGAKSSCAITSSDKLRCWGHNAVNELGDGTTTNATSPIDVDSTYNFANVSIGSGHACGVTTTGLLRCWGYNGTGAIGDGTTTNRTTPVSVNSGSTYTSVSVNDDLSTSGGRTTTCALLSSGALQCWGSNANALLANGTLTQSTTAVNVDAGTTYTSISVTGQRACGVTAGAAGGALKCWGNFTYDSTKSLNLAGAGYAPSIGSWNKWYTNYELAQWDSWTPATNNVSSNSSQSCGLKSGKLFCWGASTVFGNASRIAYRYPAAIAIDPTTTYTTLAAQHDNDNCAIDNAGNLKCWGKNDHGELGSAVAVGGTAYIPTNVDPGTTYKAVSVSYSTICAITTADELRCSGRNSGGQIGDGTSTDVTAFKTIDTGVTYAEIGRGAYHTCARTTAGQIKCWGANGFGSVGNGGTSTQLTPFTVDSGAIYKKLSIGASATCAITATDTVKCWGDPRNGTGTNYVYVPTVIDGGATYTSVSMSSSNGCGIKTDGTMKCWGYATVPNQYTFVEAGSHLTFSTPVAVASGTTFSKVQTTYTGMCATTTGGVLMCSGGSVAGEWGFADSGVDMLTTTLNTTYFSPSYVNRAINY